MNFTTDHKKKRRCAIRKMYSTLGGKLACGISILMIIGAFVVPVLVGQWLQSGGYQASAGSADIENPRLFCALVIGMPLLIMGVACLTVTYRQRNRSVAMRTDETLCIDGSLLTYTFVPSADRHPFGLCVWCVRLDVARVTFNAHTCEWEFEGEGIRGQRYDDVRAEVPKSFHEMEPMSYFSLASVFGDELDEALKPYARS